MKWTVLLFALASGCCTTPPEDSEPIPDDTEACSTDVSCDTLADCPASGIHCVLGVCVDGFCDWVNLATVETLPVDPESGLPLGKNCRR